MAQFAFTRIIPRFGEFSDAIDVPDDATPEQIDALVQQRLDVKAAYLSNPPAPPEEVSNG